MNIRYYFNLWKARVEMFKRYDEWCTIHSEELAEQEYAAMNNGDSVDWCWNCKYSDCDIH